MHPRRSRARWTAKWKCSDRGRILSAEARLRTDRPPDGLGQWRDEADWAGLEERARAITRTGWWIDQRDADGADLLELLKAATEADTGTENPFR
ncbi:hypothetical protein QQY66_48315 [Streptomyces sp. DG2A-72]|uniref:hypothetical protein n=1 Tax=Streptomyces sp. DG2A-72 TaxID=3051386 RepID=UPI00265B9022|nr:hypothetical protein [Streptomyces sp. DG2A-72]MDO0939137.1 hypothetical protein [Streptomyces sp. DG2A-72]